MTPIKQTPEAIISKLTRENTVFKNENERLSRDNETLAKLKAENAGLVRANGKLAKLAENADTTLVSTNTELQARIVLLTEANAKLMTDGEALKAQIVGLEDETNELDRRGDEQRIEELEAENVDIEARSVQLVNANVELALKNKALETAMVEGAEELARAIAAPRVIESDMEMQINRG